MTDAASSSPAKRDPHAKTQRRVGLMVALGTPMIAGLFILSPSCACPRGPAPYVQSCDGSILEACNKSSGSCVLRDCSAENATCELVDAGAQCVPNPPQPCDSTFVTQCVGDFLEYCDIPAGSNQGQLVAVDCFDLYATAYAPGWCLDQGGGAAQCEYGN